MLKYDKPDSNLKLGRRDEEGHYIVIRGTLQDEYITVVNIDVPNICTHTYIHKTSRHKVTGLDTIMSDFTTHFISL
jgi:hypothetical protein